MGRCAGAVNLNAFNKKICYICSKLQVMKKVLTILSQLVFQNSGHAQNEIGPEGLKLLWLAGIVVCAGLAIWLLSKPGKRDYRTKKPLFKRKKITIELQKDRLYYPDYLELIVTNSGNTDIDIDEPLLVFSGLWYNRKFKLKGTNNTSFYPLYLTKGQSHSLNIDLNRFYGFDKTLKRLPRVRVVVTEVNGKRLGSRKVLLRKTLFNF
jgi:hypothetical protein